MLVYDSDTRGRATDASSQGALLTTKRHQRPPAPRKEAPPTRAGCLDEKPRLLGRLYFSQRPLKAQLAYCPRPRPLTWTTRAKSPVILATPRCAKTAAIYARAAAHTAKRQLLAEGVAAAMRRRRARASHIARDHRASETTHKRRPPTRVTQTSPRALQPTHTTKPRRPSSARSRATTSKLRR